jgi:ribosome-associated translation inhibitor RaiA
MQLEATMTEIIEGPIAAVDRVYAFDEIRRICETAPRRVERVRARLSAEPDSTGNSPATAECWLLLDGGLIICAGTAAGSMRRALDGLMTRLRRRLDMVSPARALSESKSRPRRQFHPARSARPHAPAG